MVTISNYSKSAAAQTSTSRTGGQGASGNIYAEQRAREEIRRTTNVQQPTQTRADLPTRDGVTLIAPGTQPGIKLNEGLYTGGLRENIALGNVQANEQTLANMRRAESAEAQRKGLAYTPTTPQTTQAAQPTTSEQRFLQENPFGFSRVNAQGQSEMVGFRSQEQLRAYTLSQLPFEQQVAQTTTKDIIGSGSNVLMGAGTIMPVGGTFTQQPKPQYVVSAEQQEVKRLLARPEPTGEGMFGGIDVTASDYKPGTLEKIRYESATSKPATFTEGLKRSALGVPSLLFTEAPSPELATGTERQITALTETMVKPFTSTALNVASFGAFQYVRPQAAPNLEYAQGSRVLQGVALAEVGAGAFVGGMINPLSAASKFIPAAKTITQLSPMAKFGLNVGGTLALQQGIQYGSFYATTTKEERALAKQYKYSEYKYGAFEEAGKSAYGTNFAQGLMFSLGNIARPGDIQRTRYAASRFAETEGATPEQAKIIGGLAAKDIRGRLLSVQAGETYISAGSELFGQKVFTKSFEFAPIKTYTGAAVKTEVGKLVSPPLGKLGKGEAFAVIAANELAFSGKSTYGMEQTRVVSKPKTGVFEIGTSTFFTPDIKIQGRSVVDPILGSYIISKGTQAIGTGIATTSILPQDIGKQKALQTISYGLDWQEKIGDMMSESLTKRTGFYKEPVVLKVGKDAYQIAARQVTPQGDFYMKSQQKGKNVYTIIKPSTPSPTTISGIFKTRARADTQTFQFISQPSQNAIIPTNIFTPVPTTTAVSTRTTLPTQVSIFTPTPTTTAVSTKTQSFLQTNIFTDVPATTNVPTAINVPVATPKIPGLPFFSLQGIPDDFTPKKEGKARSRKRKYTPSVLGILSGQKISRKAAKSGLYSGFEMRLPVG